MTFTVTYRAKDGALREERVEAANRAECVAECRKRGIAPTGIREGGKSKGRDGARPSHVGAAGDNKRTTARWVAAAVVLAAIAGGAWWWFSARSASAPYQAPAKPKVEKPKGRDGARPSRVERVEPAKAKPAATPAQPKKPLTNWDIRHLSKDETNGLNQAEQNYWKMYHPDPPPDANQPAHNKGKYRIFKSRTDNDIAFLMATEPGTPVFGSGEFFARGFTRKFLKSLETPIVINDDDSEYDRSLKQAVIDTRQELKKRYDGGEDIEKIMRDTRDEIQRLGQYKMQIDKFIKKETSGAERKGLTDNDIGEIIKAANKMLEEKGIAPIEPSPMLRRALKLQSENGEKPQSETENKQ